MLKIRSFLFRCLGLKNFSKITVSKKKTTAEMKHILKTIGVYRTIYRNFITCLHRLWRLKVYEKVVLVRCSFNGFNGCGVSLWSWVWYYKFVESKYQLHILVIWSLTLNYYMDLFNYLILKPHFKSAKITAF